MSRERIISAVVATVIVAALGLAVSCEADPVRSADAPATSDQVHRVLIDSTYGVVCYGALSLGSVAAYSVSCVRFR